MADHTPDDHGLSTLRLSDGYDGDYLDHPKFPTMLSGTTAGAN